MSKNRLNDLALLNIYYDMQVTSKKCLNELVKKKNKLEFVI